MRPIRFSPISASPCRSIRYDEFTRPSPLGGLPSKIPAPGLPLAVGAGPTPGTLPLLIGVSEQAAMRHLQENAFTVNEVAEIRSGRYPVDAVVAQHQPPEGNGPRVSLLVNRGERGFTYVMPDLIGVDNEKAAAVLRARGFRVTVVGDHPYLGVPPGIVLRQSPQAGFQVAPGEPISLEVSQ